MNAGQVFTVLLAFLFVWSAYSTTRFGIAPYFAIMTAVLWLGVGVGYFIKVAIEVWK